MTRAYDKAYLVKAQAALGGAFDYAVNGRGMSLQGFFDAFVETGAARRFGRGDPAFVAGRSGAELAFEVLKSAGESGEERPSPYASFSRSREYWAGWALAYFQWATGLSFADIGACIPMEVVVGLYEPYHEMDIRQFADKMAELYHAENSQTRLKARREQLDLSQSQLAYLSGVPVRTIQQYEQRRKDINKAQVQTVASLAKALGCSAEDLLEHVPAV